MVKDLSSWTYYPNGIRLSNPDKNKVSDTYEWLAKKKKNTYEWLFGIDDWGISQNILGEFSSI